MKIFSVLLILTVFLNPIKAHAIGPFLPFGGYISSQMPCTCSGNTLLQIKTPLGVMMPLIYQPYSTMLYMRYKPTMVSNTVGMYFPAGSCMIYVGTACSSVTSWGTILFMGTSL